MAAEQPPLAAATLAGLPQESLDRGRIQSVKKITLDTNVLPASELLACAERLGLDVAVVSVTEREVEGTPFEVDLRPLDTVNETGVYGEARYGSAVYASQASAQSLANILKVVSNGSFPSSRADLSDGQRRQFRDALIFESHVRDDRDVFVTNDERAFIRNGRRQRLEATFNTRIMTSAEFLQACETGGL
jgi:hypothetical protein